MKSDNPWTKSAATRPIMDWAIILVSLSVLVAASLSGCVGGPADKDPAQELLDKAELKSVTEYLEYSSKDIDPVTLVECNEADAAITARDQIDLTKVGVQKVTYVIDINGKSKKQTIEFTIHDTKSPAIELPETEIVINQGDSFDIQSAIASVTDEVDGELQYVEKEPSTKKETVGEEVFYEEGWYTTERYVNSSNPGTYPIQVKASDKHGNIEIREFIVTVIAKEPEEPQEPQVHTYTVNKKTLVFHTGFDDCRGLKTANRENFTEITATYEQMIADGYDECDLCKPWLLDR